MQLNLEYVQIILSSMGSQVAQSVKKKSTCNAGDPGSILGLGRSLREENGNPLQYSCLGNPMDRGAWQVTAPGVTRVRQDFASI